MDNPNKMGQCRAEEITEHHQSCSAAGKPDRREREDVMRQFWIALEGKCLQVESWPCASGIWGLAFKPGGRISESLTSHLFSGLSLSQPPFPLTPFSFLPFNLFSPSLHTFGKGSCSFSQNFSRKLEEYKWTEALFSILFAVLETLIKKLSSEADQLSKRLNWMLKVQIWGPRGL